MLDIFITSKDIEYFYIQEKYGDIWQFIRDTCLFTSRDMG